MIDHLLSSQLSNNQAPAHSFTVTNAPLRAATVCDLPYFCGSTVGIGMLCLEKQLFPPQHLPHYLSSGSHLVAHVRVAFHSAARREIVLNCLYSEQYNANSFLIRIYADRMTPGMTGNDDTGPQSLLPLLLLRFVIRALDLSAICLESAPNMILL